jgi:hypothetical protein
LWTLSLRDQKSTPFGDIAAPTVKQHLAALKMLFDWLVLGHIRIFGVRCDRRDEGSFGTYPLTTKDNGRLQDMAWYRELLVTGRRSCKDDADPKR